MKYRLKSPIDTGQREQTASFIRHIIPPHEVWCEPYFKMGEVFFGKKPSYKEVINDADNNIINFYLMIKNRWEQLYFLMEGTLHCDFFSRLAQQISTDEQADCLHKAWAFWLDCQKAFVSPERWSLSDVLPTEPVQPGELQKTVLGYLSERLQNVYLANRDPLEVIRQTDGPNTLFFLHPRTKKQLNVLEATLPTIQGKVILLNEFKSMNRLVSQGILFTDEEAMPMNIYTNFKRQHGLFD